MDRFSAGGTNFLFKPAQTHKHVSGHGQKPVPVSEGLMGGQTGLMSQTWLGAPASLWCPWCPQCSTGLRWEQEDPISPSGWVSGQGGDVPSPPRPIYAAVLPRLPSSVGGSYTFRLSLGVEAHGWWPPPAGVTSCLGNCFCPTVLFVRPCKADSISSF